MASSEPLPDVQSRLNEFAIGLEAMMEQEEAEAEALANKLQVKKDNMRRIREAIAKLRGQEATPKKTKYPSRMQARTREAILLAVHGAGDEGVTLARVVAETGIGEETVRRGLGILRDENLVRKAGVNGSRQNLYKPMPEMASANNGS